MTMQRECPALSRGAVEKTIKEPLNWVEPEATLTVTCDSSWRSVVDQQMVSETLAVAPW